MDSQQELLLLTLQVAVPFRILELKRWKGPQALDLERAREFGPELACKGDVLLYKSKKPGETARLMVELIHAIAVMAFVPGGIKFLGLHWEA